jgi:arylsulfatase A-like enzyme
VGHGKNLYQETVSVPLIIKQPYSTEGKTVKRYVNLLDVMPTVLDLINVNSPEQTLGESVLARKGTLQWLKQKISGNDASEYDFLELDRYYLMKSIITPQWKYIYDYQDESEQLYNLEKDPLERYNIFYKQPERCKQFKEHLFQWVSESKEYPPKTKTIELSPDEEEKFKALGYVD